ncbi:MAG: AAA family ATPase [Oscillospiraceae bacterium]|jgi:putative cytidylate kinase
MKKQIIVAIGREHGSGGHYIADLIARELGVKLYDKVSIEKEITSGGYSEELVSEMDEKPVNFFASRRIGRFSNSLEVNVAEKTFAMLRSKAAEGESFVVIGRCGEQVLENNPNCISIFICGDPQFKLNRVMNKLGLNAEQAIEEIRNVDRSRKNYHNYYCDTKWGDARGYDLTVKSNVLGCERTAEMLVGYIRSFMEQD